ncbi:bifunctional proline dehydrogenase/L-glutamate gamma-semialdehyde dehydrogenase PutA [Acidihalobacter prosperus]|uniref:Bifunctional protein PutA n=1 Tax=Acidihalobacter prosperus TaxID=160660 RepID=A0A1A6C848_9GAMM|nr:bifunctional proline dehydrogenase/L-glutamate gamma-semialdehyde dehydrogenase PutA [Acidihalobacter prosperus]OBS10742.1 bifunctional proline dehydrogenase/L-glutamate gamma-semialdehyde dehydrogenase [Acidihalobacter prosperus]
MLFDATPAESPDLRAAIRRAHLRDENDCLRALLSDASFDEPARERIRLHAEALIDDMLQHPMQEDDAGLLMAEYGLDSAEGQALMGLAEALLRIPDGSTAGALIRDRLGAVDWRRRSATAETLQAGARDHALAWASRLLVSGDGRGTGRLRRFAARAGEPLARAVAIRAMRRLGRSFVFADDIERALHRAASTEARGGRHAYDMLGEAAMTEADALRYLAAYRHAIDAIGRHAASESDPLRRASLSVKLSALHPRYEYAQRERVCAELLPRLRQLCLDAAARGIALCIDAEETSRLEPSLDLIERLMADSELHAWTGFGVAVQAYQKRAPAVLEWLLDQAERNDRKVMIRLVKGAYWDTEIKLAQQAGLDDYPVYTRRVGTDVAYLACARRLLARRDRCYPLFATHNAHTVAAVLEMAGDGGGFEYQRLYGMGAALYARLAVRQARQGRPAPPCRVYAPIGSRDHLLAYLIRRLLENGANGSFVHRVRAAARDKDPMLCADPAEHLRSLGTAVRHPLLPLPSSLYGDMRTNAAGLDLTDEGTLRKLDHDMQATLAPPRLVAPLIDGHSSVGDSRPVYDPADLRRQVGSVVEATRADVEKALATTYSAAASWAATPVAERAACLDRLADLYQGHRAALMALCVREAGRTVADALAEVREAVDFCRYYAAQARNLFSAPHRLPGPTGEDNRLSLHGRGVFVCISPWNFPLAIFTGQIAAALAAGNAVIAKPAEQTPLIAGLAVELMLRAGIPPSVLALLPGDGSRIGPWLTGDPRIAGVAFTGSTLTAQHIQRGLAERQGPMVPLIAETGGLNAMIADSTALPEQLVRDVVQSAFSSAGQRCSALRVLYLQDEIAETVLTMLSGALDLLATGDPARLSTDVGPVIDADARADLEAHAAGLTEAGRLLARAELSAACAHGHFVAPAVFRLEGIDELEGEVFGPFLHVVRWRAGTLDQIVDAINATGYGLTLGVHSRIESRIRQIADRARVGNLYANRNMIGAVVGVQPFGGEGLSGTGFKAGGPHYLLRFSTERVLTINTAAVGGDAGLLARDA